MLDCSTAVELLEALGCSGDPITHKGEEIEVGQFLTQLNSPCSYDPAGRVRIWYYPSKGRNMVFGSLKAMVQDRFDYEMKGR